MRHNKKNKNNNFSVIGGKLRARRLLGELYDCLAFAHLPDGVLHFDGPSSVPVPVPPGLCGALVGPMAISIAVAVCRSVASNDALPLAKLDEAMIIAVAKRKCFMATPLVDVRLSDKQANRNQQAFARKRRPYIL